MNGKMGCRVRLMLNRMWNKAVKINAQLEKYL